MQYEGDRLHMCLILSWDSVFFGPASDQTTLGTCVEPVFKFGIQIYEQSYLGTYV